MHSLHLNLHANVTTKLAEKSIISMVNSTIFYTYFVPYSYFVLLTTFIILSEETGINEVVVKGPSSYICQTGWVVPKDHKEQSSARRDDDFVCKGVCLRWRR